MKKEFSSTLLVLMASGLALTNKASAFAATHSLSPTPLLARNTNNLQAPVAARIIQNQPFHDARLQTYHHGRVGRHQTRLNMALGIRGGAAAIGKTVSEEPPIHNPYSTHL
eukprot:CAMPEP_0168764408 /NCGR_PEP_ID=MMETSP0724-20121128/24857_1 /TAXON_ID=265536 /ORGANISM="Amphiprora sp., Strain CCMP467" /LENGTH=110 /DNA_ID=CAMNT_0008813629 /DNA_START=37 /DNA_END=372 /DNA_ORIENTATION=+